MFSWYVITSTASSTTNNAETAVNSTSKYELFTGYYNASATGYEWCKTNQTLNKYGCWGSRQQRVKMWRDPDPLVTSRNVVWRHLATATVAVVGATSISSFRRCNGRRWWCGSTWWRDSTSSRGLTWRRGSSGDAVTMWPRVTSGGWGAFVTHKPVTVPVTNSYVILVRPTSSSKYVANIRPVTQGSRWRRYNRGQLQRHCQGDATTNVTTNDIIRHYQHVRLTEVQLTRVERRGGSGPVDIATMSTPTTPLADHTNHDLEAAASTPTSMPTSMPFQMSAEDTGKWTSRRTSIQTTTLSSMVTRWWRAHGRPCCRWCPNKQSSHHLLELFSWRLSAMTDILQLLPWYCCFHEYICLCAVKCIITWTLDVLCQALQDGQWLLSLVSMDSVPFLRIFDLYCIYEQF